MNKVFITEIGKNMYTLPAYVGIILIKDDEVLLVQRTNTDWMSGHWNFPGGLLEAHESLLQAAQRETNEEVGVHVHADDFELVHVLQVSAHKTNTKDIIGFYFASRAWQGTVTNKEPHKHSAVGWFKLTQLPQEITEHALQALQGLQKGIRYSQN